MATMPLNVWVKYKDLLAKISNEAANEFRDAVFKADGFFGGVGLGKIERNALIDFAYALVTKYSEASSAAACVFYDELAALSGVVLPPAIPAEPANYGTVAKAVSFTDNEEMLGSAVGRLVKQAGQDTTLQNALRDGAEFAWIPSGDTCAFCITLASRGWQTASKGAIKNGHAEHIHGNCDCAYAVRFNSKTNYAGYDPAKYEAMYKSASTDGAGDMTRHYNAKTGEWVERPRSESTAKINAIRREIYKQNADEINAQKRDAYAKQKERESSESEETDIN